MILTSSHLQLAQIPGRTLRFLPFLATIPALDFVLLLLLERPLRVSSAAALEELEEVLRVRIDVWE